MNDQHEDVYFIDQVLRGNREAFRSLVERYHGLVYSIAYSMTRNKETAQDTVQETFYRAFRNLSAYNSVYPFGAWVRRIAVNYILDQRKKKKVNAVSMTTEDDMTIAISSEELDPRMEQLSGEREQTVLKAIARLPEKYRMILMLRHYEELTYEEIAETLSLPLGTVMTQLHRARNQLAELLSPMQAELQS